MLDFTMNTLRTLYDEIRISGYEIMPFYRFLNDRAGRNTVSRTVILRHDVDNRIDNALKMAALEHSLGINSTYYIRYRKHLFNRLFYIFKQSNKIVQGILIILKLR